MPEVQSPASPPSKPPKVKKLQGGGSNPWFAACMGLLGVIVGYSAAVMTGAGGDTIVQAPSQVAQVPTPTPTPPPPPPAGDVEPVNAEEDHIKGNPKAKISIIEYSDYECPFCKRHHPTMEQVLEEYGDDVNWVYRHFPLSFHPNAQKSAEASECVAELAGNDAFWEFTDKIFDGGSLSEEKYLTYATELGINGAAFTDCLDSGKYEQKVKDQFASGSAAGVRGTPGSIIINNETEDSRVVSGALPFTNFKTILDEMLGT